MAQRAAAYHLSGGGLRRLSTRATGHNDSVLWSLICLKDALTLQLKQEWRYGRAEQRGIKYLTGFGALKSDGESMALLLVRAFVGHQPFWRQDVVRIDPVQFPESVYSFLIASLSRYTAFLLNAPAMITRHLALQITELRFWFWSEFLDWAAELDWLDKGSTRPLRWVIGRFTKVIPTVACVVPYTSLDNVASS